MSKASPARVAANDRYNRKVYESIALRVVKGTRSRWHDAAADRGLSLAALIVAAVTEYIQTHPPDSSPADLTPPPDAPD